MKNKIYNCICCDAEIKSLYDDMSKDWESMWLNGVVDKINANYGSGFDGDMYSIGICDSCIKKKTQEGKIKYVGNYMFPQLNKTKNKIS